MRLLVFIFCVVSLQAQIGPAGINPVRGEVRQDRGDLPQGLVLEAQPLDHARPSERVPVGRDGHFELHNLVAGGYQIRISNSLGAMVYQELVSIHGNGDQIQLRMPDSDDATRLSGKVSAARLLHPVPSQAAKEFARAQKALSAGDTNGSIEHLQKALARYPDYLEAHNNLGVRYMALQEFELAQAEFQKAVALDPDSAKAQLNLSLALSTLRRPEEAEEAARRAVRLEPESLAAHYSLGQILAVQGKDAPEALAHLRNAAEAFPRARLVIARVLTQQGLTRRRPRNDARI